MGVRQIPSDLRRAARVSGACEPGVQVPPGWAFVVPWRATPELCDWLAEEALRDPSQVWYVASSSAAADEAADQHYVFPAAWIAPDAV